MGIKNLVLMSGGFDSTYTLIKCLERTQEGETLCLFFEYGQRNKEEYKTASKICTLLNVDLMTLTLPRLPTNTATNIVTNRNAIFLVHAHAIASEIGVPHIWAGFCERDYAGFPDCRERFLDWYMNILNLTYERRILGVYPTLHKTKAQIWEEMANSEHYDILLSHTLTCYHGDTSKNVWGMGCGNCTACLERMSGYNTAEVRL